MEQDVKHIINITIKSQSAESGPPLGTVLGNIGVNAIKFAKDFNEYTAYLPNYFKVNVKIYIYRNNNYKFIIKIPNIGYILSLLKKESEYLSSGGYNVKYNYINLSDLLKLSLLKFPNISLERSIKIVLGSVKSANIIVKLDL
jgi:ribosomal protein L11